MIEDSRVAAFSPEAPPLSSGDREKFDEYLSVLREDWGEITLGAGSILDDDELELGVPVSSVLREFAPDVLEALQAERWRNALYSEISYPGEDHRHEVNLSIMGREAIRQDVYAELEHGPSHFFNFAGRLSELIFDDIALRPVLRVLKASRLEQILGDQFRFLLGGKEVSCPAWLVKAMMSSVSWFTEVRSFVEAPVFDPAGRLPQQAGHDDASAQLFIPRTVLPPISEEPTAEEVTRAVGVLEELICEFPFADRASRANTYALLLTPVLRPAIAGRVPLAAISAPTEGTGKTLLAEQCAQASTGRGAVTIYPPSGEAEFGKLILAELRNQPAFVLIDNWPKTRALSSESLASTLSAAEVTAAC